MAKLTEDANAKFLKSGRTPQERLSKANKRDKANATQWRGKHSAAFHEAMSGGPKDAPPVSEATKAMSVGKPATLKPRNEPKSDIKHTLTSEEATARSKHAYHKRHQTSPDTGIDHAMKEGWAKVEPGAGKKKLPIVAKPGKTIDQVKGSQERKEARVARKRAPKSGYMPSSIGAKARAAANKLKSGSPDAASLEHSEANVSETRHSPKATETDHLSTQQFSGGRHSRPAPTAKAVKKNAMGGDMSMGRHSSENTGGYVGRHRGGYNEAHDALRTSLSGSISYGKHSSDSPMRIRGNFEPLRRG